MYYQYIINRTDMVSMGYQSSTVCVAIHVACKLMLMRYKGTTHITTILINQSDKK